MRTRECAARIVLPKALTRNRPRRNHGRARPCGLHAHRPITDPGVAAAGLWPTVGFLAGEETGETGGCRPSKPRHGFGARWGASRGVKVRKAMLSAGAKITSLANPEYIAAG